MAKSADGLSLVLDEWQGLNLTTTLSLQARFETGSRPSFLELAVDAGPVLTMGGTQGYWLMVEITNLNTSHDRDPLLFPKRQQSHPQISSLRRRMHSILRWL